MSIRMNKKIHIYVQRFYEVVEERPDDIWTIYTVLEEINKKFPDRNKLLVSHLRFVFNNQKRWSVFRNYSNYRKNELIFRRREE
jgi:hypothetical protein